MNTYSKIAFSSYFLIALMTAYMGIRYLVAGEIRPHHLEIIGVHSWSAILPDFKVMLLMLMKGAGLGYLTTAVALFILLLGPFRKNEKWSIWGLLLIISVQLGGRFINILIASSFSPNSAPIELLAIAISLALVGFFCSLKMNEKESEKEASGYKYPLISIASYSIIALMSIVTGVVYSFSGEIMSYHLDALGISSWDAIEAGYQTILLTYMRGAGLGFFTTAAAVVVLLVAIIRKPNKWLRWGILTVSLTQVSIMIWIVLVVRINTPGTPPIAPLSIAFALAILGFLMAAKKRKILS